jgi:hypothetical protein
MKRIWLVLLLMFSIVTLSTQAFAVDVKFSGEFYAAGMYLDKTSFQKDQPQGSGDPSTAFYFQRLRLRTDFIVSPGLTLVTSFDAMERAWGAPRSAPVTALDLQSQGTRAENENIAFDLAYVSYASPIGIFGVGYQVESTWGTVFGNSNTSVGKLTYALPIKNFTFLGQLVKHAELSRTTANPAATWTDADYDAVYLMALYNFKYGVIGLANFALFNHTTRIAADASKTHIPLYLVPFAQLKFGPVSVQTELLWQQGKRYADGLVTWGENNDAKISALAGWLDVTADFGIAYAGGTFAYVSGDDPATQERIEGGTLSGGNDWNPCLILWNYDRARWVGNLAGNDPLATPNGSAMANGFLYQLRAGARPLNKLDIMGSVTYARAERAAGANQARDYGWEVDVTGTYKITNNLSYMLGAGYLFAGKYYKGEDQSSKVSDNFIVINKLTLTF